MDDRKRKWVYWSTFGGSFVVIYLLLQVAFGLPSWLLRGRMEWFGSATWAMMVAPAITLARWAGGLRCRRLGLSLEGKAEEVLTHGVAVPSGGTVGQAAIGRRARVVAAALMAGFWAFAAFILVRSGFSGFGCGGAAFALSISLLLWWCPLREFCTVSVVDDEGITQHLFGRVLRRIPWEQVERCAVERQLDALGRSERTTCTLYDRAGKEILQLDLALVPARERNRFLNVVRARHEARTELIASEAPAGTGTELEAAQAPAGRGTEPVAEASPAPVQDEPARAPLSRWRNQGHE